MKIERSRRSVNNYTVPERVDVPGVKKDSEASFDQEMARRQDENIRIRMQELLVEMDAIKERLARQIDLNELMLYKKLVKNFLQEAVARAYAVKQERGRNRRGRTLLITIKTIDTEIDKLVRDFINKSQEPVEILQHLDKIRGMLIDLMA